MYKVEKHFNFFVEAVSYGQLEKVKSYVNGFLKNEDNAVYFLNHSEAQDFFSGQQIPFEEAISNEKYLVAHYLLHHRHPNSLSFDECKKIFLTQDCRILLKGAEKKAYQQMALLFLPPNDSNLTAHPQFLLNLASLSETNPPLLRSYLKGNLSANFHHLDGENNLLILAVQHLRVNKVKDLLKFGALKNWKDCGGSTVLHYWSRCLQREARFPETLEKKWGKAFKILDLLDPLEKDWHVKNYENQTPLNILKNSNHLLCQKALSEVEKRIYEKQLPSSALEKKKLKI